MNDHELIRLAREALPFAYAPYSGYRVGAALLTVEGRIFQGVNVENASYGLTICAERAALAAAVAAGYSSFAVLAVASEGESEPLPCGACRQVLREFGSLRVVVAGKKEKILSFTLEDLLPYPFTFEK
ncbi:MAG: cytidine deaminase [Dethiobacter sp.]|jgi:cytidine deaminase|nr:MAG: cytidine deaminase [Dethiobacter sp.]